MSFDCGDKILTYLKTCLWIPVTYKQQIVGLSSAQFGQCADFCFQRVFEQTVPEIGDFEFQNRIKLKMIFQPSFVMLR